MQSLPGVIGCLAVVIGAGGVAIGLPEQPGAGAGRVGEGQAKRPCLFLVYRCSRQPGCQEELGGYPKAEKGVGRRGTSDLIKSDFITLDFIISHNHQPENIDGWVCSIHQKQPTPMLAGKFSHFRWLGATT
jgi:hypothetical protein